jgi:hypothetical protein
MKNTVLILFYFISVDLFSQTEGYIIDIKTNNPVPFANIWVENENTGTTSDKEGVFYFKDDQNNKFLIITSIGYEKHRVKVDSSTPKIFLVPITYMIPEVLVTPIKKKELKVNPYRKSQIHQYTAPTTPQIFARFFPFQNDYRNFRFIKAIRIETLSKTESIINLRFFKVNQDGQPGNDLFYGNLIINIKKGRRNTIITNFNNTNIQFPTEGLFVAIEYIIVKENEYEYEYFDKESKKKNKVLGYMPMIGTIKTETSSNSWVFRNGKWEKDLGKSDDELADETKNHFIAMELTLTN